MSEVQRELMERIFFYVKQRFVWKSDLEVFKEQEHWATAQELPEGDLDDPFAGVFHGDCDDFTGWIRKLALLYEIPTRRVNCFTETGEYHQVCEALGTDDHLGMIYDNRQRWPMEAERLQAYRWHKVSGYQFGEDWRTLEAPA